MGEVLHLKSATPEPSRVKLSKSKIDRIDWDPDGTSWQVTWDTEIENLGVRVRKRSKNWILLYRTKAGKRRCWTMGPTAKLTVKMARDMAEKANARIVLGEDPSKEKQEAKKTAKVSTTFDELAREFIDDFAKQKRKTWERDAARLLADPDEVEDEAAKEARRNAPIRELHKVDLAQADVEEVEAAIRDVHAAISVAAPVEANRVAQTVNRVLNYHVKRRNIPRQFHNILEFIDLNEEGSRDAFMRPAELESFALAVRKLPKKWRGAIWLSLLTGARLKSEVLQLRWDDIHPHAKEFTFRETKNGKAHTLPITPAVGIIFDAIPRKGAWVFPSRKKGQPVQDSRKTFEKVRKAGRFVDKLTPHVLRHSAKTYLEAKLHVSKSVANAALNHADHGMSATYTHADIDDIREALVRLEGYLFENAKIDDFADYMARKRDG